MTTSVVICLEHQIEQLLFLLSLLLCYQSTVYVIDISFSTPLLAFCAML